MRNLHQKVILSYSISFIPEKTCIDKPLEQFKSILYLISLLTLASLKAKSMGHTRFMWHYTCFLIID